MSSVTVQTASSRLLPWLSAIVIAIAATEVRSEIQIGEDRLRPSVERIQQLHRACGDDIAVGKGDIVFELDYHVVYRTSAGCVPSALYSTEETCLTYAFRPGAKQCAATFRMNRDLFFSSVESLDRLELSYPKKVPRSLRAGAGFKEPYSTIIDSGEGFLFESRRKFIVWKPHD